MNKYWIGVLAILLTANLLLHVWPEAAQADENVVLDQGVSVYPIAERLAKHYIENLPERPKTNKELLLLYKTALKNFEKTIMECDKNDYSLALLGFE